MGYRCEAHETDVRTKIFGKDIDVGILNDLKQQVFIIVLDGRWLGGNNYQDITKRHTNFLYLT